MKRLLQLLAAGAAVVLLVAAGFVISARLGLLNPSDESVRAKYALTDSKFIEIDGETIHYVDEGSGDPVVLVHGSFGSLLSWNQWAKALTDRYRVIRFDRPGMGLSGPNPNGKYDTDHEVAIIEGLTDQLGLKRFFLVATSSGGASGAEYAANHPERLTGLILSNIALGHVNMDPAHYSAAFKRALLIDPWLKLWHPEALWRGVLLVSFADPEKVTPTLVTEWTDLNNRRVNIDASRQPRIGPSPFDRTAGDLGHITTPTLLLWSANDHEVPVDPVAETALKNLAATDKALILVPHCGHMMPIECGAESVTIARDFFDHHQQEPSP